MQPDATFSPVVVAPTFNNAATLRDIVGRIARVGLPVIVVNDGSTDGTAAILAELGREMDLTVISHARNLGKGDALRTGFSAAGVRGFTHAVTIDTDAQLDPEEIPALLDVARSAPGSLVVGVRDETTPDYPKRSRTGRWASNLLIRRECGLTVADSQCGFRVYPLDLVSAAKCRAGRFGFETEIIVRAGWAGASIVEVPVSCRYPDRGKHCTHFRPWVDSFRAVPMHARLMGRALMPWPHKRSWPEAARNDRSTWKRLAEWASPARAWRDLRDQQLGAQEMAAGVAIGVFIANLPLYGFHTVLSLFTARRLHLHPIPVVAGSHLSTPPVGPVLVAAAIGTGHWLLHGTWMQMPAWQQTWREWARLAGTVLLDWSIGSLVVGAVLAGAAFVVATMVFRYVSVARD
jgi:glycosyltransferase involved in cell wall biosynthesis